MALPRVPDDVLIYAVRAGVALILLTPLVVSPETIFPFVVGKALYSRSLIEIVFVSWALLFLLNPSWRPPRSRILVLLAAALAVAALSAGFGVSVQRSFWSNYERMQGVVDQTHWFALAVVLVSVLRTGRDWRILLNLNLIAGMAVALMTVSEYHGYPWFYAPPTTRVTATLGNPSFLGAYLGVNVTMALGFLVRSFVPAAHPGKASAPAGEERGKRSNRSSPPRQPWSARFSMLWAGRCFWGATVLIGLWALTLTASRGPFLGFVSGLAALAMLYAFLARTRMIRLAAAGSVGLFGAVFILLLVLSFSPAVSFIEVAKGGGPRPIDAWNVNPLLSRLADDQSLDTVRERLATWRVGIKGFLDRPMLGWGPENYIAIWGRHGSGEYVPSMREIYDHSHNKLIEELATKGLPSLLVHLAIWGLTFHIVLRAARDMDARERIPVLFAGAALMGYFMQSMTTPDMAVGSLQFILLLAFVAHLETAGCSPAPAAPRNGTARRPRRWPPLTGSLGARVSLAAGTIVLAGAGLFANKTIYSSARAVNGAYISAAKNPADLPDRTRIQFERAIDGFQPLANYPRRILFQYAAERWEPLRAQNRAEAMQLLAMVDAEASAAVEDEPLNWRIQTALSRFYEAVAITDPEYRKVAKRYREL